MKRGPGLAAPSPRSPFREALCSGRAVFAQKRAFGLRYDPNRPCKAVLYTNSVPNASLLLKSKRIGKNDKVKIIALLISKKLFLKLYNKFDGNVAVSD